MKQKYFLPAILLVLIVSISGCAQRGGGPQGGSPQCSVGPDEWMPGRGDCPGETAEQQAKCTNFCKNHLDCCSGEEKEEARISIFPDPIAEDVAALTRNYPAIIKAINEGPAIYSREKNELISDERLGRIIDTGFNTVQILTINDCTGERCVMDASSKSVLVNDIVKIKQKGLAVWVAVEYLNAPPGSGTKLPEYEKFKESFLDYCREVGELVEEYKVEYLTVNNEPDLFLQEQTQWGSEAEINKYVAEMLPLANGAAREKFTGKMINKVTQTRKRPQDVLDASFLNVDIASVDVGPPIGEGLDIGAYRGDFLDYQHYAGLAKKAGVPWMVGEYWQANYFEEPSGFAKSHQVELAQVSFDEYLKTTPKGVGYSWNDFSVFGWPNGEKTRLAAKEFFGKI